MQSSDFESDLEVGVAQVLEDERYAARALWWERSGLLNPEHHAVHMVRLLGAYRVEDKFAKYYLGIDTAALSSRWYLRIDDDSQTKVSGLIEALDRNYNWTLHLHCRENHALYAAPFWGAVTSILDELGLSHIYEWGL